MRGFLVWAVVLASFVLSIDGKVKLKRLGPPDEQESGVDSRAPQWAWITQRVNHFNASDLRTWEMRYIHNDQFFEQGGPLFIFLGGEWAISANRVTSGQMFDMAQQHNGYMFYTEHRYYGQSFPTQDISTENLQFLSVDQALADLAYFIEYQKMTIPGLSGSQVVVVGGSYSASMATWARLKYPHLVNIGYASSGPLRAVADFYEYYEVVNDNIALVSRDCLETIREAIVMLENLMASEDGLDLVSEQFNTCTRSSNEEPQRSFFFNIVIAEIFAELVQYATVTSIPNACTTLANFPGTSLDKLASYVRYYYGSDCVGDYDEFIETYSSPVITNDIYRQWLYQTCTEYGYYQTTTSNNQPFGNTFPLVFFIDMCTDLFGARFDEELLDVAVERTNIMYGSVTPKLTQVVSVHGTVDPWHPLGILEDLHDLAPAILINGTSHCQDLSSISSSDIPALANAKRRVQEFIAEWLLK